MIISVNVSFVCTSHIDSVDPDEIAEISNSLSPHSMMLSPPMASPPMAPPTMAPPPMVPPPNASPSMVPPPIVPLPMGPPPSQSSFGAGYGDDDDQVRENFVF